jgi:hypothetical protein
MLTVSFPAFQEPKNCTKDVLFGHGSGYGCAKIILVMCASVVNNLLFQLFFGFLVVPQEQKKIKGFDLDYFCNLGCQTTQEFPNWGETMNNLH